MTGCWFFARALTQNGYGVTWDGHKVVYVHRLMYELYKGPILEGKEIDHLCRNRSCINPDHLEQVTKQENIRRGNAGENLRIKQLSKTQCPQGHPYNEANTYHPPKYPDRRDCLECRKNAAIKYRRRQCVGI